MSPNASFMLHSDDGLLSADIGLAGGMLSALTFRPGTPQATALLYRAHWLDDAGACAGQPPLMHRLGGEWVGVPFGHAQQDGDGYLAGIPHGLPANRDWTLAGRSSRHAALDFVFPPDYPLTALRRVIQLADNGNVNFSLRLQARRPCRLPVGLHPVFPIGGDAGELVLSAENALHMRAYPQPAEPGVSRLQPGAVFDDLRLAPAADGATLDLSRLPLPFATEEILQVMSPVAGIELTYPQRRLALALRWDTTILPHCLLWISNGGRRQTPWSGKNYCLGVEPVCSAWDLGPACLRDNAISQSGYATALALTPEQPLTIDYRLTCRPY
ncbi:hypothetical protein [Musicola keenii]|uniref:hypothetical protein n=1 Tax=Musicola keenii TaxID=2884250 RepID=UPI00178771DD|nr:hypothetical protein [Musicola keenii]